MIQRRNALPRILAGLLTSLFLLWTAASPAFCQGGAGLRAGASADPDQFYFGGHLELGPLVQQLWFRPNLEMGIGNARTLVAVNGEFASWFPLARNDWSVCVGAGPAINIIRFDEDRFGPGGRMPLDDTEVEGGFNILLGLAHDGGLFTELKVGALRSPELKLGIGYTFR